MQSLKLFALAATAALALAQSASAQESWPARTITLVVPFGAGSGTDIGTRSLAKSLGEAFNVPVLVDNRPGANGAIGAQFVARAKPDGYTLLVGSATTNAANFAFFPGKLGYEPGTFEMVGGMSGAALALHVAARSPYRNVADLIAAAKAKDAKFSCGSGNAVTQVACEMFRQQAGVAAVTVPYKSNPQSLTDVVGGQLNYAFSDTAASQALVQGGQLRIIGIAGTQRNAIFKDAATFPEQGYPNFLFTAWTAVFAPAGTPAAVQEKLNAAINKWLDTPEATQLRERSGSFAMHYSLPEAKRFAAAEVARWGSYIKESNVRPE